MRGRNRLGETRRGERGRNKGEADLYWQRGFVAAALGPDVNVPCLTFARSVFPEASMITTLACPKS